MYDSCIIKVELGPERKSMLIVARDGHETQLFPGWQGPVRKYKDMDAMQVYKMAADLWGMVGKKVIKRVIIPNALSQPTWYFEHNPYIRLRLEAMSWQAVKRGYNGLDSGPYERWYVTANAPLSEIPGIADPVYAHYWMLTPQFMGELIQYLCDYGLHPKQSVLRDYSPTGETYSVLRILANPYSRRILVTNHWYRDV